MVRAHPSPLGRIFGRPRRYGTAGTSAALWTPPAPGVTTHIPAVTTPIPAVTTRVPAVTTPFDDHLAVISVLITHASDRVRLDIDHHRALLFPLDQRPLSPAVVLSALHELHARHFSGWVESIALADHEVRAFAQNHFTVRQSLRLLTHDLHRLGRRPFLPPGAAIGTIATTGSPPTPSTEHVSRVLELDRRAFPEGLGLDVMGLRHSLTATPTIHMGAVWAAPSAERLDASLQGFSISGRVGRIAYLQRLAVDPVAQGRGVGTALVDHSLRWARRHGARRMVVNTQQTNTAALRLYTTLGFEPAATDLTVMGLFLAPVSGP
jgi:GNAT superfamily N-acetyltransferase